MYRFVALIDGDFQHARDQSKLPMLIAPGFTP
jgi:hypothetical protein